MSGEPRMDASQNAHNRLPRNGHNAQRLELTEALLERLRGRMSVIQPPEERRQLVASTLEQLCREHGPNGFPELTTEEGRRMFLSAFLSYDMVEGFLADPAVEDIMVNSTEPIFVHKTGEGMVKTTRRFATNRELAVFVKKLIVFGGRSEADPIHDLELADVRGRVNIIHSPFGPQITITRRRTQPFTILQLIERGMLTYELAAQLWMYVEGIRVKPANLIISGGPGSGKTTLLNALLSFIPWKDRVVVIEDTLELNTRCLENCSRLESCRRVKTPALVKNSLRMRPERVLVGEVRGEEARDLMTTMNLGKWCMGTLHASSARETVLRLQHEPMNVPPVLVNLVDVFIILQKQHTGETIRRVVSELVETAGLEQQIVLLSTVWSADPERDRNASSMSSSVYRDRLAAESGRTAAQIMDETTRRAEVLRGMRETNRFTDIDAVTRFCQGYSEDPERALRELGVKNSRPGKR